MTKHNSPTTLYERLSCSETFIKAGYLEWITNHKEMHQKCLYVMLIKGF